MADGQCWPRASCQRWARFSVHQDRSAEMASWLHLETHQTSRTNETRPETSAQELSHLSLGKNGQAVLVVIMFSFFRFVKLRINAFFPDKSNPCATVRPATTDGNESSRFLYPLLPTLPLSLSQSLAISVPKMALTEPIFSRFQCRETVLLIRKDTRISQSLRPSSNPASQPRPVP